MKRNFLAVFFTLIFLPDICFPQRNEIDSLLVLVKKDKADTNKVIHLKNLCWKYGDVGSYDTALQFGNAALALARQLQFMSGMASSYNEIGLIYFNRGDYPGALKNHFLSLKIREEIGDLKGAAASYNNLGNTYEYQGNYPEALKNHFASLSIREKLNDKPGVAGSYTNIGNIYTNQGNYTQALKNYLFTLKIYEEMQFQGGVAYLLNNIGYVYFEQHNYQEALKNYHACLKIVEALDDKASSASAYGNIGNVYLALAEAQPDPADRRNKLDEALKNYLIALKLQTLIGEKAGIAQTCANIGSIYTKKKEYRQASEYLIKAKELSKEIGYLQGLKFTYGLLTTLDSTNGNYKGAFENHKLFVVYRDSLDNEETRKKTIQSQMTYDFEKKEAVANAEHKKEMESQKVIAEEKNRKQKMVLGFTVFGLLLVLVFAGFIFRSLRITRKQKHLIELQKEEVTKQKEIVDEKQKEILDSIYYAKRIQMALITNEKYIERHLNKLNSGKTA